MAERLCTYATYPLRAMNGLPGGLAFAAALLAALLPVSAGHAATLTAAPASCSSSNIGNQDWLNPGNARTSNNSHATADLAANAATDYLLCNGFGLALPAGATVNGITVGIERRSSNPNTHRDAALYLVKGGATTGSNLADTATEYPNSDAVASYGGAGALWGTTWSAAEVNAANFGVAFSARNANGSGSSRTVHVDAVSVTVDYTPAPAALVAQYRFEEGTGYSGAADELQDSAGAAGGPYHGRAYRFVNIKWGGSFPGQSDASPARPGDPGTCKYATLDNTGHFRIGNLGVSASNGQAASVALWMYWDGSADATLLNWENGYGLVFHDGKLGFTTFNAAGGRYDMYGVASAGLAGGWHHVVAVFANGLPAANRLYIDGQLATPAQTGTPRSANDQAGPTLFLGRQGAVPGDWFLEGRLDEVKVYAGELGQAEVAALYAETHACSAGCAALTGNSPIQFVAANAPAAVSGSTVAALAFNRPAGTAQNDVMVAQIAASRVSSSCVTVTPPAGWTQVRTDVVSSRGLLTRACTRQSAYYKVAGAAEPASYSFALSNGAYATGAIASYRGADSAAPIMTSSGQTGSGTGNITAPSLTTTRGGARLLGLFAVRDGSDETIVPPACMTERVETATGNSAGLTLALADSPWGTAGATGNRVATVDDTDANLGQLVALQPPAAVLGPSYYNAFDTATAAGSITGNIRTKVAGSAFTLAVVALNSGRTALYGSSGNGFAGTVKVELLGNSALTVALDGNNCPTGATVLHSGTLAFAAGNGSRRDYAFPAVAEAWRNVRVRVSYPASGSATTVGCSTDNFAIRPAAFAAFAASDANWTTAGSARTLDNGAASGGVVHAAGRPFSLAATAVNSAGATTGQYSGSPTATLTACPLPAGCAVDGSGSYTPGAFDPGAWTVAGGVLGSSSARYGEAGTITVQLVDDGFAAVDAGDGSAADCSGRQVCSAAVTLGRFVPDHFELATRDADDLPYPEPQLQTFGSACASRAFTYVGQPFGYVTVPRALVMAKGADGNTTANYPGFDAGAVRVTVNQDYGATTPASPALATADAGTPSLDSGLDGTAELALDPAGTLKFSRAAPIAPFTAAVALSLGVSDASEAAVAGNGTITSSVTADYPAIAFDAGAEFRYGRLRLANATGSELLALPVPLTAQYWDGRGFVANPADQCTALAAPGLTFYPQSTDNQLASGETAASYNAPLVAGAGNLRLSAPGTGNYGYLDVGVDAPDWLKYNWDGSDQGGDGNLYDDAPRARAAFGRRRGSDAVIIRREIY